MFILYKALSSISLYLLLVLFYQNIIADSFNSDSPNQLIYNANNLSLASNQIKPNTINNTNSNNSSYAAFQEFDKEFNFAMIFNQVNLKNGQMDIAGISNQEYNIEIERLYNNGIWFNLNANLVTQSLNNQINGQGSGNQTVVNQYPALNGMNLKLGNGILFNKQQILFTPYLQLGRNANLTASVLSNNHDMNITNDFYITIGGGARIEYQLNKYIEFYFDQAINYNFDQSSPLDGIMPQNTMLYTSMIGSKFNVYKQLQLGVNLFYNNYQNMASLPQDSTGFGIYTPTFNYGGALSIGLTY